MSPKLARRQGFEFILIAALTIGATIVTYVLVWLLTSKEDYFYKLFYERSWIQYASTLCFWLATAILVFKQLASYRERQAYEQARQVLADPQLSSTLFWSDADGVRQKFLDKKFQPYQSSITFTRIANALHRLRMTQSTNALEDYFHTRSDIDSGELDSSYANIRYFTWLIPTLGFIGTVMGIGIGIAEFAGIIQTAEGLKEIQANLPIVTNQLGTAFDTTLLALGYSAIAVFYMSFFMRREEQLLEEIDNLCFDGVCPLFQEHSTASDEIIKAFNENVEELRKSMNGNRAAIENVIRREFPTLLSDELAPRFEKIAVHLERIAASAGQLVAAQSRTLGVTSSAEEAINAMHGLAGAFEEVKALRGVSAVLARNNQLLEGLQHDLQKFREAAETTRAQSEALIEIVGKIRQTVQQMPQMAELLQALGLGIDDMRKLVEHKSPQLEEILQENGRIIDRAATMLARSHEGSADVLSALTKLINRIDERNRLETV